MPKESQHNSRHFETIAAARPGWAAKRDVMSHKCLFLEVMAGLQLYRFEPERVPNLEDSESENEEVNDRLEGTF